jgi:exosortase E/protease (VPEID-CTERM system)
LSLVFTQASRRLIPLDRYTLPLTGRIACLAALLSVELVSISIWLDLASLSSGKHLVALVHDWGAWTVRIGVAFLVFSLVFAESKAEHGLQPTSDHLPDRPIAWPRLVAHSCVFALFLGLSWFLFNTHPAGLLADFTVVSWIALGLLAAAMAALAFVPAAIWLDIVKRRSDAWVYGLTVGIVAYLFGTFAWGLWQPLSRGTFAVVRIILHPLLPALISDPSTLTIGSQTFLVTIAPQCSGYEGVGLVVAFTSAWLWFLRHEWRFPRALLLLPAGAIAIWAFNCVRIAALILIGHAGAPRIALGGFHSQAGWIGFTAVTIGVCVGARRMAWLARTQAVSPEGVAGNLATPYLVPFFAVLTAALISRAASADFEWLYPLRVVAAAAVLWYFRSAYQELDWRAGWPAFAIGALVFCVWLGLDSFTGSHSARSMPSTLSQSSPAARLTWLAFRIVGAVVAAPITEELAYRGFLMRRLTSRSFESVSWRHFSWMPIVVSSLAYGVLQGRQWLAGTIAGFFFALALLRKGRIGEAVAAHATANGVIAIWVIFGGNWQMW